MEKLEFKGTKGALEPKYISGICIGIGTIGNPYQVTANSILPNTDNQYKKEKKEIEANMKLYASSKDLLDALQELLLLHNNEMEGITPTPEQWYEAVKKGEKAIEKALKY